MPENNPSRDEIQADAERNYRWNFTFNVLDGASFWFGMSFMSYTVILPLFVNNFTHNPVLIGLIPFLTTAGVLLPQIFVANWVERAPLKKFFPVTLGFFTERVPIFLLIPLTYFLATTHPELALAGFFVLLAWHTFGAGMIIIGWQDMIAKIFSVEKRGRYLGISNFIGNGAGVLGALAVPFVLERSAFPNGYVMAFTAASVMVFLSWVFIAQTREPAVYNSKPPVSQTEFFRSLPAVVRGDRNFRMYLLSMIFSYLSGMASGFLVVYAVQTWKLPDAQASGFTVALQIGLALANLFFGLLADRKGHKLSLEICMLLSVLSLGLVVIAPNPAWFYAIFFLRGVFQGGTFVSGIAIVYEFTDPDNRPTYIGLANTLPGIAGAVAPLIGGWMAAAISYQVMFITSAVIAAVGLALLRFTVREPRKVKVSDTVGIVPATGEE